MAVKNLYGSPMTSNTSSVTGGNLKRLALGAAAAALLTGCGAIYYPVYAPSESALLIKDDERFPYDLQVVNITIASAQEANVRWPYTPRSIPSTLRGDATPSTPPGAYTPLKLADASGPVSVRATTQSVSSSLPRDQTEPYRIGAGDVLQIVNVGGGQDQSGTTSELQNTYLVDQDGRVFVPQLEYIPVAGKTVEEVRADVLERMKKAFISPVAVVNVTKFRSQSFSVTGRSIKPVTVPVTMQPVSLREALLEAAANNIIYDTATIGLTRSNGQRYRVPYASVVYDGNGSQTILRNGDRVIIDDSSGNLAKQAELDTKLSARDFDAQRIDLTREQLASQALQRRLSEQQLELSRESSARDAENLRLSRERLEFERQKLASEAEASRRAEETLRLQIEREGRESQALELQRLNAQRETQALQLQIQRNEREREAFELERAKSERERAQLELAQQNFDQSQREFQLQQNQFTLQQQDQALRERSDLRAQEQLDLSRLETQERLGSLERDFVFVSGEVGETVRMPMPYNGALSLADALFTAKGFDPVSGNPKGIHVVRTENGGSVRPKVYVFRLDGSNIANLSAATVFKMRPDDVLYVTPQPVSNWNRTLTQLLGGTNALVGAASRGGL